MGPHTQLHPVGMTTYSPLPWYLPLFLLLLALPWIQGALKDSSQLSCFYNSRANISCTWSPDPALKTERCRIYSKSKLRTQNRSCELLCVRPTLCTCDLILGGINSQSLTVADVLVMTVSCLIGEKRMVMEDEFIPFQNIRLMAPSDLCLIQQEEHTYKVSWEVPVCSHYLNGSLMFEARYQVQGSSWEKATVLPIKQDQRWISIENLAPDTTYEFQVRGKPKKDGTLAVWSPWSQSLIFQTKPQVSTFKMFHLIMSLCGIVGIFLVILLVPKQYPQKWLKKVLKCHIPDPSKFFSSLSTEHGGDFQKWLSSPFPTASFTTSILAPEISPLEVMQKEDLNLGLLLSKELVPAYRSSDTSGQSLSSCFTNQGYFFFHLPDALEVESCQVYFTYEPFSEEEENKEEGGQGSLVPQLPPGGPEDDSYCTFPPGDDMILFSPRLLQGPGNNLGLQSISFSGKEDKKETSPPEEGTATAPSCDQPSFSRFQNSLDSRPESTQDEGLPLDPESGPASPFPWDIPPVPDQTHAVLSSYPIMNTGAYLSLGELQNHGHSA
ncbi:interleukin-2 receptor subunit beta [Dromiciops gliroides]|uniref:interleukin-2 receptor subunit beta n=1 Tax=Dromiciops gliroides TaxID=33562 RepID=UPI001CC52678|nr:interleukin-2 receptor subunit beta [Dromiciops gliroides]